MAKNQSEKDYERGVRDRNEGRSNQNHNWIAYKPDDQEAYQKGYDYARGQQDANEGRSNQNHNWIAPKPSDQEAYQKGYDSDKNNKK